MSEIDQTDSQKKDRSWAWDPFNSFSRDMKRAIGFYGLTMQGLSTVAAQAPRLEELYAELREANEQCRVQARTLDLEIGDFYEDKESERVDEATRQASALAQLEVDEGFPTLHRQVALSLWSSLEWLISDLLANWLANAPNALSIENVRKVKVSIADYENFSGMDKYYYLLSEIERDTKSALKQGVGRFEATLQVFGLAGSVPEAIKKDLFEFGNVRNVLVHRNGVADARFVNACPWVALSTGQAVIVDEARLTRYIHAVMEYVGLLRGRLKSHFGGEDQP
jgi:hypothetical protein